MDSLGSFMALNRTTVLQITKIYSVPPSCRHLRLMKLSSATTWHTWLWDIFDSICPWSLFGEVTWSGLFQSETNEETLVSCLVAGVMCPFPQSVGQLSLELPRSTCQVLSILVYCHCHMPDIFNSNMIACDHCKRWYHLSCVGITKKVPERWQCTSCVWNFTTIIMYSSNNILLFGYLLQSLHWWFFCQCYCCNTWCVSNYKLDINWTAQ